MPNLSENLSCTRCIVDQKRFIKSNDKNQTRVPIQIKRVDPQFRFFSNSISCKGQLLKLEEA